MLMLLQVACAVFFVYDVSKDLLETRGAAGAFYLTMEALATLSLLIAIAMEWKRLVQIREDRQAAVRLKQLATGKLSHLMNEQFRQWGLTQSEADVAELTIKGCSISEIALLRNCREGTIKSHLNAIYRKSNTKGRAELVCLIIEDLMAPPLIAAREA